MFWKKRKDKKELKIYVSVDCGNSIARLNDLTAALNQVREAAEKLKETTGIEI